MFKRITTWFSSIGVKLFFSFWLIAIASFALSQAISSLLIQEAQLIEVNDIDRNILERVKAQIEKRERPNIKRILKFSHELLGASLFLKSEKTGQLFYHKKRHSRMVASYLRRNSFENLTSIQFPFARLTGPKEVIINDERFQLFITTRTEHHEFTSFLIALPRWAMLCLPFAISMALCWLLARYLTRPISAMTKATESIGDGNYKVRVLQAATRRDELGNMARSFNTMAEKLDKHINAHQRLLADVSHEFRSPLTRLQITLGLIERSSDNPEKLAQLLQRGEKEVAFLDDMIGNVLSLSRHESGSVEANKAPCQLETLIQQACDDAQFVATEKHVTIALKSVQLPVLTIDSYLLMSAVSNILNNAIRYSEQGDQVTVHLTKLEHQVVIEIADAGTGVNEADLDKLFTAFYRVSDSRERGSGGTGLGLAIAKQAVDLHQGEIFAFNNEAGGLTVSIKLPI